MIDEDSLLAIRHPFNVAMIAWACIGFTVFAWNMARPLLRWVVFSSPRFSESTLAYVKEANIISINRDARVLDSDKSIDALDLQFIVEYAFGGKRYRSELKNIYSGNQELSGACPQDDRGKYLECVIRELRKFAPNSAFTFKQHRSSGFPLDTASSVIAASGPGVADSPVRISVCRLYPAFNNYSMNHEFPTWRYFWIMLVIGALTAPVPFFVYGYLIFRNPETVFTSIAVNWKWCLLMSLLAIALIEATYGMNGTPRKGNYVFTLSSLKATGP